MYVYFDSFINVYTRIDFCVYAIDKMAQLSHSYLAKTKAQLNTVKALLMPVKGLYYKYPFNAYFLFT